MSDTLGLTGLNAEATSGKTWLVYVDAVAGLTRPEVEKYREE